MSMSIRDRPLRAGANESSRNFFRAEFPGHCGGATGHPLSIRKQTMSALQTFKFRFIVVGALALTSTLAPAQTVAPGPYYATPSWGQKLPASTRFIVLSNWASEAVLDRETGLVWEKTVEIAAVTWISAQSVCAQKMLGGRRAWRLPSLQELLSLVDGDATRSSQGLPTGHPFTGLPSDFYWTATTDIRNTANAWAVLFGNGTGFQFSAPKTNGQYFWCVRGGSGLDTQ